ncbi:hypothetical protein [Halorubrum sp. N11]|uniref:hypothetical protein n=1 Tax=Halorubrum sp. N11 TaxID=3402276 RepID=UPI003EB8D8A3
MGDEPGVGDDDSETKSENVTIKTRTFETLREEYPHALDDVERVRMAVHDALEETTDDGKSE